MKLYNLIWTFLVIVSSCTAADQAVQAPDARNESQQSVERDASQNPPVYRGDLDTQKQPSMREDRMEYKRGLAQDLVNKAVSFFKENSVELACYQFREVEEWQFDEMYPFVIHEAGTIYAHGKDDALIWQYINDARQERQKSSPTEVKKDLIEEMREAVTRDGWLNYEWNFENKHVYVREVEKDGRIYFIGTGFYPESHKYIVQQLVNQAVDYSQKFGTKRVISQINNPTGQFVKGPLYLWLYDFEGMSYAHGDNSGRVGRNHMDWQGAQGTYLIKDAIEKLQEREEAWIEFYEEGNVLKRSYVRRYKDPRDGKRYFIGGGYYPDVDSAMVKDFVREAVNYLKSNGPEVALRDFTSYNGGFRKGPLRIYVYDMEGTTLADGQNPEFVGQNMLEVAGTEGGDPIAKEILRKAKQSGEGTTTFLNKNQYQELYYQKVTTPDGEFIVGSGYWPDTKRTTAESLAQNAAMHLEQNTIEKAFQDFTTWSSDFVRGDLFIEVIDYNGIIVAYGPRNPYVWSKIDATTDEGYNVADVLISTAQTAGRSGGWVTYTSQGRQYKMYVSEVAKNIETHDQTQKKKYVVGVFYV